MAEDNEEIPGHMVFKTIQTKAGNGIQIMFNRITNLLCIDLIDKYGHGGNEIVRVEIDEDRLLRHLRKGKKKVKPDPDYVDEYDET